VHAMFCPYPLSTEQEGAKHSARTVVAKKRDSEVCGKGLEFIWQNSLYLMLDVFWSVRRSKPILPWSAPIFLYGIPNKNEFVPKGFEFVPRIRVFVPKGFEFVPKGFEFVPRFRQ
jgi:hypothetical protein